MVSKWLLSISVLSAFCDKMERFVIFYNALRSDMEDEKKIVENLQ